MPVLLIVLFVLAPPLVIVVNAKLDIFVTLQPALLAMPVLLIVLLALAPPLLLVLNAKLNIFLTLLTQPALPVLFVMLLMIIIARVVALPHMILCAPSVKIALLALLARWLVYGLSIAVMDVMDTHNLCAVIARLMPRVSMEIHFGDYMVSVAAPMMSPGLYARLLGQLYVRYAMMKLNLMRSSSPSTVRWGRCHLGMSAFGMMLLSIQRSVVGTCGVMRLIMLRHIKMKMTFPILLPSEPPCGMDSSSVLRFTMFILFHKEDPSRGFFPLRGSQSCASENNVESPISL